MSKGYGKLNQDGTLSSRTKQADGWVSLDLFTKDEQDNYYEYYQSEMVDGMYVADTVKLQEASDAISNASIYTEIDKLELKCIRPSRELNKVGTATEIRTIAKEKLAELDAQIEELRAQLKY